MNILTGSVTADATYYYVFISVVRFLAPVIVSVLLFRCIKPLLTFRREPEIWAWLELEDGTDIPITHWENVIGSSKRSDVVLDAANVEKTHGVLTRYDDGSWTIANADSRNGVFVNDKAVTIHPIRSKDVISIGDVRMRLQPISAKQEQKLAQLRTKASSVMTTFANLLLLTVFQGLCYLGYLLGSDIQYAQTLLFGFGGIAVCQWALFLFYVCIQRNSFEIETLAFFLSTMGMAAIAATVPDEAVKQLISLFAGVILFLVVGIILRDLGKAKKMRYVAAAAGLGLLAITLLFGVEFNGAKAWLFIGSFSIQPSELAKICFVFAGVSTMDRIVTRRNLFLFIAYSVAACGLLALMNDFGTALIFFCAFLVIAYMRSGSVGTVALAITSLVLAGVVLLSVAPHALARFDNWRHIWEDPLDGGYQQTRALMCMAAGGFLGLGPGRGKAGSSVYAADSDMVMATLSEEWGLYMFFLLIICVIAFAVFAIRSASVGRSSFYTIGSCAAASIFLIQAILNALGTVDVVPLTGVTFPFVSNGGSSMIAVWGLLAFVKAADTRQNASFAVKLTKSRGDYVDE